MRLREVLRIARRAVPGSGTPSLSLLSAGLRHHTYRVERDGHTFSLRLARAPLHASPPASRCAFVREEAWVLRVLQLAADQSLAPPLVCGDAQRGITVQNWVEGGAWPAASVRLTRNIERFAALLRRLHALPVPAAARTSSPALWIRKYAAALAQRRAASRVASRAAVPALAAAAGAKLARLEALPGVVGVVCHSDLHRLNVLEYRLRPTAKGKAAAGTATALLLLDWEYAHVADPFWDLAGWSANNDFPDDLQKRLLTAYLGRAPDEADWTRCTLLRWLYDYVCLLWSELYLCSRPRIGAADVESRAAVLRARLSAPAQ